MEIRSYLQERIIDLPVSGNGTDLVAGAMLARGVQNGCLRLATTTDFIGVLRQAHTASGNDTTTAGTVFTTRQVELSTPVFRHRVYFSLDDGDLVTCTHAVSSATMDITSIETTIQAGFLYVVSGTGNGQMNYITSATTNELTLKAQFTTDLDTTSKFIKILPRFHDLVSFTSDNTRLASQAAAGTVPAMILDIGMINAGNEVSINPVKHSALTGLATGQSNHEPALKFWADVVFRDSAFYTLS